MKILDQLIPTNELGFGKSFCPKMIISHYRDGAWTPCELSSNLDITLSSASKVFHYAQEVFEGLKAYKTDGGRIHMFRPQENIRRMTKSANLLAMPPFSEAEYLDALKRLCRECK